MFRLLVIFFMTTFPTTNLWASNYIGNYECEPTFVVREAMLFLANGKDDTHLLITNQNSGIDIGLIDEDALKKMEIAPEDFQSLKLEMFQKHSFRMQISENYGQITQTGQNGVDTYFEHVLVSPLETDPKILMGYTEYTSKIETNEFWFIRDSVFYYVLRDAFKYLDKTYDTRDVDIGVFSEKKVAYPIIRNMLKNLATSKLTSHGSWIKISQSEVPGTLNFSADNAGLLLDYNVKDTEKFRAVCKLI